MTALKVKLCSVIQGCIAKIFSKLGVPRRHDRVLLHLCSRKMHHFRSTKLLILNPPKPPLLRVRIAQTPRAMFRALCDVMMRDVAVILTLISIMRLRICGPTSET
jgi:hypothetical protein